ncbi:helix-turn-helix transcriptional regulator [Marinovum sp.]|uniref:helix-turn-helix transcriptional regulator n=1 Tax=Marinovum sp. TaxID=2024839 RepID=UPI002B26F681|nr:helix-turn-helix transcriptional regulator [Marinovum sp.]
MTETLTHHEIYDAALDNDLFKTLPRRLARDMGVPSALFFWLHPGDLQEVSAGTQPETNDDYVEFMQQDPWMDQVNDDRVGTGAFRLTQFVAPDTFQNSLMYNEFIVKNRLERFWCLGLVQDTRDGRVVTAFHKGKRDGDFTDEQVALLNRRQSDLGRMHAIRRELIRNRLGAITAADGSLNGEVPMFELNHEGQLLRLNGLADFLLRQHPFFVFRNDKVLALGGPVAARFRAAVGQATDATHGQANTLDLPQVRGADGRVLPAMRLNLLPRTHGGRHLLVIATTEDLPALKAAVETPDDKVVLTARELDVLRGLTEGKRRDQLAFDLDISVATVDLHSGNVRRKLGARTMLEAVARAVQGGLL